MTRIRDILRLHYEDGLSQRQIAETLNLGSKSTAGEILKKARELNIGWPLAPEHDDEALAHLFYKRRPRAGRIEPPDWDRVVRELESRDVTLEALWREYRDQHPDGYSYPHFCRLFREYRRQRPMAPSRGRVEADTGGNGGRPEGYETADRPALEATAGNELKYLQYFGLSRHPFPVAPDADKFYISEHIEQIMAEIVHGILTRKGFMVLTGDVGLGKTTISRRLLNILESKGVETSLVFHTTYQDVELLREINRDFGLECDSERFGDQMKVLNDFLMERNRRGGNCAIIIDDAQNLDTKSIELVRMISNLETNQAKLVQILLIGQPELMDKLDTPELRQVKSRIMIQEEARPLTLAELEHYLMFKLNAAGNRGKISIPKSALKAIHGICGGNFRRVNVLVDRALYVAYLRQTQTISAAVAREAQKDLRAGTRKKRGLIPSAGAPLVSVLAAAAIILAIVAGVSDPGRFWPGSRPATPSPVREAPVRAVPERAVPIRVSHKVSLPGKKVITPPEATPPAIVKFLEDNGLTEYRKLFYEALKENRVQEAARQIYKETGLQLVTLKAVPDHLRAVYGILAYPAGPGESYYLFWRPAFVIERFYYHYKGDEIQELQRRLSLAGFYEDRPDNTVGKNLMLAVNRYQQKANLEISGFPDETTIFLLCHEDGE